MSFFVCVFGRKLSLLCNLKFNEFCVCVCVCLEGKLHRLHPVEKVHDAMSPKRSE